MSELTANKQHILNRLYQGGFISGQQLGEELGISRAGIAKHIKSLQEFGLDIHCVSGKGYCLSYDFSLLSSDEIAKQYQQLDGRTAQFESFAVIDSTNSELMRRIAAKQSLDSGSVVVAEAQTAGRGRRGRKWQSPFGANLYYSYYWQLDDGLQGAMGVSIAVGLAIYDCIDALYQQQVSLKWPNDVLVSGQKLAGVLVELDGPPEGPCQLVIGIGLNLKMPASYSEEIDQAWTDLSLMGCQVDKNQLVAQLTHSLEKRLAQYAKTGLSDMYQQWNQLNAFKDERVDLITGTKSWQGICEGIDQQGGLCLRRDGEVKAYYGGELSLRKVAL